MTAAPSLIRTLYHGTTRASADALCGGEPVNLDRRPTTSKDFGRGFYMTSNPVQAEAWAKITASYRSKQPASPAVIRIEVDFWELSKLHILAFANSWTEDDYNGFWSIIEWCRSGKELPRQPGQNEPWDIVIGQVASVWGPARNREGYESYDQIAFVSESAIELLTKNQFKLVSGL